MTDELYTFITLLPSCLVPTTVLHDISVSSCKGMAVMENKGYIVVKKIDGGSILAKDGRIRVGDRILAINGKSIEGLSLVKVR
jgi:C-terminal processing protease CtpA/Prc